MTRKHRGIIQEGDSKGKLKKGFFYSGERTKNGLPVIKEKKHIQNGGTGSTARNLLTKSGKAVAVAATAAFGEIAGKSSTKMPSVLSENVPKFSGNLVGNLSRNLQKLQSSTQPIQQNIRKQDSIAPGAKPRKYVSKGKTPKSTKTLSIVPIHVRTNKLFSDILKTNRNTGMKSIKIIDTFIQETIESFLNPVQDGDLFMQLNNLEPLVILRIIIKATRSVVENLALSNTEEEIKDAFSSKFNDFLSHEMMAGKQKSGNIGVPLSGLFTYKPFNQTLIPHSTIRLLTNKKNLIFREKEKIVNVLGKYNKSL